MSMMGQNLPPTPRGEDKAEKLKHGPQSSGVRHVQAQPHRELCGPAGGLARALGSPHLGVMVASTLSTVPGPPPNGIL